MARPVSKKSAENYQRIEREAFAYLKRADPLLFEAARPFKGTIASRVQPKRGTIALFTSLCSSIVSQQLSTKAAASIFARLKDAAGGRITPETVLAARTPTLRSAGLSEAKVRSLQELAEAVHTKRINLLSLKKLPAEEAIAKLCALRGIGPWTAEMFLIFAVGSPDIYSPGDLILERRMMRHLSLPSTTSKKELARLAERWSPHRSFVSLVFWRLHHEEVDRD